MMAVMHLLRAFAMVGLIFLTMFGFVFVIGIFMRLMRWTFRSPTAAGGALLAGLLIAALTGALVFTSHRSNRVNYAYRGQADQHRERPMIVVRGMHSNEQDRHLEAQHRHLEEQQVLAEQRLEKMSHALHNAAVKLEAEVSKGVEWNVARESTGFDEAVTRATADILPEVSAEADFLEEQLASAEATGEARAASAASAPDVEQLASTQSPVTAESEIALDPPDWIGAPPVRSGDLHKVVVMSGPYSTRGECADNLAKEISLATDEYVRWYLEESGKSLRAEWTSAFLKLPASWIDERIASVYEGFHQSPIPSLDQMPVTYALLEFDPAFRQRIDKRWTQSLSMARLAETGSITGGLLGVLAVAFGYLQLNQKSRGRYRGWLRLAAAAAILLVVFGGLLTAQFLPWI